MSDEQHNDSQNTNDEQSAWELWLNHPMTQAWQSWAKLVWQSNPVSQLIPLDIEEMFQAIASLGDDFMARPKALEARLAELLRNQNNLMLWYLQRSRSTTTDEATPTEALFRPQKQDRRFKDDAWESNLLYSTIKQNYLMMSHWLMDSARDIQSLDEHSHKRTMFFLRQWVDAISPSNFPLTNPVVMREILESGGASLQRGMRNLVDDLERGEITVTPKDQFTLGKDLACSPGKVVLRNELIELIQYTPTTEQVYSVPILFVPPWINKFYILDIRPGQSMVEHLVNQGFTVFMISWRNPDETLEHLSMDDYLQLGTLAALEATKAISASARVNVIGFCLGGTLLAITLAYLNAIKDNSVASGTFFTALQDFAEVGETSIFISEDQIVDIEDRMSEKGYLDSLELSSIFRLMRSNDLIWNFYINNYLRGKDPAAYDLMYWSVDGTRMPREMHSYYLRNMYLENNLVKPNHLTMLGQTIDLGQVRTAAYVVAGLGDHIVPWRSAHRAGALFGGKTELVLSYGGHITSIINPPHKKRGFYLTNGGDAEAGSDGWLETATRNEGSWWPHWLRWLKRRSGKKQATPQMGNDQHPPLMDAPGQYVLG